MSKLMNIRDVSEGTRVQIPHEVLYGEDSGVREDLDFIISRVETSKNMASYYGHDTVGNKLKLTFTGDQQYEYIRVFEKDHSVVVEDLKVGDLVIVPIAGTWDLLVGSVITKPRINTTNVSVGIVDAEDKARNYVFRHGELVETFPDWKSWEYHRSKRNKKSLSVQAAKYREIDSYRLR